MTFCTHRPVLRLITCRGSFDRGPGHYRDNVIVFATRYLTLSYNTVTITPHGGATLDP
jgi:hypothetical protein